MTPRKLVLILVAYHPSAEEVARLQSCLAGLTPAIGYGVVANDYRPNEPVERLRTGADFFAGIRQNQGYGRAVNCGLAEITEAVPYVAALNTDLEWDHGTFERILVWLDQQTEAVLAVPQIVDQDGIIQLLCKRDPTVLALLSRRFVPERLKPAWLRRYDARYVMEESGYGDRTDPAKESDIATAEALDAAYLSGCCMVLRAAPFRRIGGFDERYFLYLEDADLTRELRRWGRCVHLPFATVRHRWGRGNHRSWRLTIVNLQSAWLYFNKWGWRLW